MVPASHLDLLAGPHTGVVTTVGADGYPQSSAMWFMWEDGRVWLSAKRWAAKYRNVERHPQVGLVVIDPADEFRYVEVRGTASVGDDPDWTWRDRIRAKHGMPPGAPDADAEARVVIIVEPVHVVVH